MKKIIITIFATAMLSGCGVYKNYERPKDLPYQNGEQITKNEGFSNIGNAKNDSSLSSINSSLPWRTLFTDAYLQKLIEQGLKTNTDLETARQKVKEADATMSKSRQAFLPSLSGGAEGKLSSYDGNKATKTYDIGLSTDVDIDANGSLRNAKKSSEAQLYEAEAQQQDVQSQLIASIADSYYTLLTLDSELKIEEQTVGTWEENIKAMRALYEAGQETEAAVSQNEASLLSERRQILKLKQQISEQENSICALIGTTNRTIKRDSLDAQQFPYSISTNVSANLLSNRPDVHKAEYALQSAFYTTNRARSAFYPSISLSGSAGWTNNGGMAITNPGKILLSLVGSLTQPIYNKGQNKANLKIAQAQEEEAKQTLVQTLLDAGKQVNNALTQWQTARSKQNVSARQTEKLRQTLNSTQLLMENTTTTSYLEVLTARQSLLSSQLNEIQDKYDEIEAVISLYCALGGGTK
jgi:multidrug efflux system outer membrane protein